MPGLVDSGVVIVLRTALPSDNAFFTPFDQSSQGLVASTVHSYFWLITIYYGPTSRKYGRTRFLQSVIVFR